MSSFPVGANMFSDHQRTIRSLRAKPAQRVRCIAGASQTLASNWFPQVELQVMCGLPLIAIQPSVEGSRAFGSSSRKSHESKAPGATALSLSCQSPVQMLGGRGVVASFEDGMRSKFGGCDVHDYDILQNIYIYIFPSKSINVCANLGALC